MENNEIAKREFINFVIGQLRKHKFYQEIDDEMGPIWGMQITHLYTRTKSTGRYCYDEYTKFWCNILAKNRTFAFDIIIYPDGNFEVTDKC